MHNRALLCTRLEYRSAVLLPCDRLQDKREGMLASPAKCACPSSRQLSNPDAFLVASHATVRPDGVEA